MSHELQLNFGMNCNFAKEVHMHIFQAFTAVSLSCTNINLVILVYVDITPISTRIYQSDALVPDSLSLVLSKDSVYRLRELFSPNVPHGQLLAPACHQVFTVRVECYRANGQVHHRVHNLRYETGVGMRGVINFVMYCN